MSIEPQRRYDLPTAVTFFLAGLGVGSLLTVIFSPDGGDETSEPTSSRGDAKDIPLAYNRKIR